MKVLFLHRNFPAQFRHIAPAIGSIPGNEALFITQNDKMKAPNVMKYIYKLKRNIPDDCHGYLRFYETASRTNRCGLCFYAGCGKISLY